MGDAKRKRLAQIQAASAASRLGQEVIDIGRVAAAVRQVIGAITDFHGADCRMYAHIGAGLLSSLGMGEVKVVAGSAAWRVGSGDSDVVSHAREINGMQFSMAGTQQAALFHSWIETPDLVIDFSTATLRAKAAMLDAADGGKTTVDWCPDFIWYSKGQRACLQGVDATSAGKAQGESVVRPRSVLMAPNAGVFNYTRHSDIESFALSEDGALRESLASAVFAAQSAYAALGRGETIKVIGVSQQGEFQETPDENVLTAFVAHHPATKG